MLSVTSSAHAESPSPVETAPQAPVIAFLNKRVVEELATEGVMLVQRNLALRVVQAGPGVMVSILDASTTQELAWSRVAELPADREASVAAITHVAADLVTKLSSTDAPRQPAPQTNGNEAPQTSQRDLSVAGSTRDRSTHDAGGKEHAVTGTLRRVRESLDQYRRERIRFTRRVKVEGIGYQGLTGLGIAAGMGQEKSGWPALRGEQDIELSPTEFYAIVGRPDLADAYRRRRRLGIGGMLVGVAALAAGTYTFFKWQHIAAVEHERGVDGGPAGLYQASTVLLAGVGLVGFVGGAYLYRHRQPMTENEAKVLAEDYNRRLYHRIHLGDDTPSREHRATRSVQLAPYVGHEAGLLVTGSF
ncbi:MAG: hypothetical protein AB7P03_08780 [Kofleriaceae bacterium]